MQWFLTTDGEDIAKVTSGTTAPSNMQAELKVLYKLLLDIIYGGGSTYAPDPLRTGFSAGCKHLDPV